MVMSIVGYILTFFATLVAAWLIDMVGMGISWLIAYPRRSRLDLGFITRIRWYERITKYL